VDDIALEQLERDIADWAGGFAVHGDGNIHLTALVHVQAGAPPLDDRNFRDYVDIITEDIDQHKCEALARMLNAVPLLVATMKERDALRKRQQELLSTITHLSATTPYPEEIQNWESQRAKMIAEIGTLRAEAAALKRPPPPPVNAESQKIVDKLLRDNLQAATTRSILESATVQGLRSEIEHLQTLINTPRIDPFIEAVKLESVHQIKPWGAEHDASKRSEDWIALLTYFLGKTTQAHYANDPENLKRHIITGAAVALNWHRALTGESIMRRPGVRGHAEDPVCDPLDQKRPT